MGAILVTQQPGSMSPELLSQADNWFCFHLLSEGDAGTLGKYNSHYSHDVLAHLIGEPISGNCYMWSAPKQPFVLPVRIRSFEELDSKTVNKSKDATPFEKSAAKEIRKKSEARNKALAKALQVKLKDNKSKLSGKSFDEDVWGIYDGQLYMILKDIKQMVDFQDEFRSENELKTVILNILLDCQVTIQQAEHGNKGIVNYYCAPEENWKRILN